MDSDHAPGLRHDLFLAKNQKLGKMACPLSHSSSSLYYQDNPSFLADPVVPAQGGVSRKEADRLHAKYALMHEMLTGIHEAMSACMRSAGGELDDSHFGDKVKLRLGPGKHGFQFKDYSPQVFAALRSVFQIDSEEYLASLTGNYVLSETESSGKSGSLFYYSHDCRFVIKTIRHSEHLFFREILQSYYHHVRQYPDTLLTRFLGLHRIKVEGRPKIHFVVMKNIFPGSRCVHRVYDLKGSTFGRWASDGVSVRKDCDWIADQARVKLHLGRTLDVLRELDRDRQFLQRLGIMDYSLLVGIHYRSRAQEHRPVSTFKARPGSVADRRYSVVRGRRETGAEPEGYPSRDESEVYFLGVIDVLTPYRVRKRLERVAKSVYRFRRNVSVADPARYSSRFLNFMLSQVFE